jgi:negative elongation factor B
MDALKELEIPGPDALRHQLTHCDDPLKAIAEFQNDNGILLPSLRPMLPLLDLHNVRRLEFHTSIVEELKEKLMKRVCGLGRKDVSPAQRIENDKRLKDLLDKYFIVIRVPSLQPVIMTILKNLDHLDDKYIKELQSDRQLYSKCDVVVKRQIWQENQGLFGDEVSPLFSKYIKEKESLLLNHLLDDTATGSTTPFTSSLSVKSLNILQTSTFFSLTPKQRRQNDTIQQLVKMVGKNVMLYDTIITFLRTLFLRTKNVHYCTLRVELLMALHDAEVKEITTMDSCHKFAWCLDACIRDNGIDPKKYRELQSHLDSVKKDSNKTLLGEIAMTLCDHYAVNFLATFALGLMNKEIVQEHLPREHTNLHFVLRLLNLGLHAHQILHSQVHEEPKLHASFITEFLPTLMSLIVDDQVRALNAKHPSLINEKESARNIIEHSGPPPESFVALIANDCLASLISIYYLFQVSRQKDKQGITRILGQSCLSNCFDSKAFDNPFLHTFVHFLIQMPQDFADEDFCNVVLDDFFLSSLHVKNTAHHLMKLMYHVLRMLSPERVELLMQTLNACSFDNEPSSKALRQALRERVGQHDTSVNKDDVKPV